MDAFISSTLAVALAEIGDKTQLLALFLALRFSSKLSIIWGILVATLVNHFISAFLGVWAAEALNSNTVQIIVGLSFIVVGLWLLKPDKAEEIDSGLVKHGAFIATLVLFFLAEIGDKTQIATVLLGAKYQSLTWVVIGSTLGMLIANVPVVYLGSWLMNKIPFKTVRYSACVLFCLLGVFALFKAFY